MVDSFSSLILWSCIIGFGISFILNILFNAIQKKDSRDMVNFGSIMGWGLFLSLVAGVFFIFQGLGL